MFDVPLRRLYLKLMEAVWRNWSIRWAHEGIVDLAEYLGIERSRVTASTDDERITSLAGPKEKDWVQCVGSFRCADELRLFPLSGLPEDYVVGGLPLTEACNRAQGYSTLDVGEWTRDFPTGGFHVDVCATSVDFWVANDCANLFANAQLAWPGWKVAWHRDNYESQLTLTGGALKLNERPRVELADRLIGMLLAESKPVDVVGLAERLAAHEGGQVQINEFARRDDRLPIGEPERRAILVEAFERINGIEKMPPRELPVG